MLRERRHCVLQITSSSNSEFIKVRNIFWEDIYFLINAFVFTSMFTFTCTGCPRISNTIWKSYKFRNMWPKLLNYDSNERRNSLGEKLAFRWIMMPQNCIFLWFHWILFKMNRKREQTSSVLKLFFQTHTTHIRLYEL